MLLKYLVVYVSPNFLLLYCTVVGVLKRDNCIYSMEVDAGCTIGEWKKGSSIQCFVEG